MRKALLLVFIFGLCILALVVSMPNAAAQVQPTPFTPFVPTAGSPPPTPLPPGAIIIPIFTPAVTVVPTAGCAAPLNFRIGQFVALEPGVNLRNLPSLSGAVVNYYEAEVVLRITDGPVCANDYNWWRVEGVGNPGWVVEGRPGRYFLEPAIVGEPTAACFTPLGLRVGGRLVALNGLRVRENPSTTARVLTTIPFETRLDIIGGPSCTDGQNWWQVRAPFGDSGVTVDGWVAEGYPEGYLLEGDPPLPTATTACARPLRLRFGSRAAVTYDDRVPRRLRSAPSESASIVYELVGGVAFEVIGGPTCADNYNWWQVRISTTNVTGWIAEGRPGDYWFEIIVQ